MKHLLTTMLVMISMTACGESAPTPSAEQVLYTNFLNTYKPLESCLNEQLGGVATDKAATAIVKAGKLDEINQEAVSLLPSDDPRLLKALKESDSEKKAFALLDALVEYRANRLSQGINFDSYGLLREAVAGIVLSDIKSVRCEKPKYLEYWAREADRADIYINLAMEVKQFSDCAYAPTGGPSSDWSSIIFEAKKTKDLEMLASRVFGENNSRLNSVLAMDDSPSKVSGLIYLLAENASIERTPDQSREIDIRQTLGLSGIKLIYVQAKKLECELPKPSWHDEAWSYIEKYPVTASPSPLTTTKVDTP